MKFWFNSLLFLSALCIVFVSKSFAGKNEQNKVLSSTENKKIISEEARRHMARGQAAEEIAKGVDEYDSAIDEYQQAVSFSPNWPDPYYRLGVVYEKGSRLKEAAESFKNYIHLAPNVSNIEAIKEHIYKLEYKVEQILTVPEVIDVLISLSDESSWKYTGNCMKSDIDFKRGKSKDTVYVMTAFNLGTMEPWFDMREIKGSTLEDYFYIHKFKRGDCTVNQSGYMDDCYIIHKQKVEVVSKRLVRVEQTILKKVHVANQKDAQVDKVLNCTYSKK